MNKLRWVWFRFAGTHIFGIWPKNLWSSQSVSIAQRCQEHKTRAEATDFSSKVYSPLITPEKRGQTFLVCWNVWPLFSEVINRTFLCNFHEKSTAAAVFVTSAALRYRLPVKMSWPQARGEHVVTTCQYCIKTISLPSGSPTILVFWCQISSQNFKGVTPSGGIKQGRGGWNYQFSVFKPEYLENGSRYG